MIYKLKPGGGEYCRLAAAWEDTLENVVRCATEDWQRGVTAVESETHGVRLQANRLGWETESKALADAAKALGKAVEYNSFGTKVHQIYVY